MRWRESSDFRRGNPRTRKTDDFRYLFGSLALGMWAVGYLAGLVFGIRLIARSSWI